MSNPKAAQKARAECPAWIGVDVAKQTMDAAIWFGQTPLGQTKDIPAESFARTPTGTKQMIHWALEQLPDDGPHRPEEIRIVMEATGKYSTELATWLNKERPACAPAIINPYTSKAFIDSLALRNNTDRLAARALARYGAERQPAAYEPPSALRAQLRDICRYRQSLISMRQAEANRASEPNTSMLVKKLQRAHIKRFNAEIEKIEKQTQELIKQDAAMHSDSQALDGIFGIGQLTAATILAELGDLRRFKTARQLVAFAGLSPRRGQSGTSVLKKTHMCKQGSSHARRALYMPCLSAIRGQTELADVYRRLKSEGKPPKVALGAVMRKMLTIMRAILISGQPYQKHYQACGKPQERVA